MSDAEELLRARDRIHNLSNEVLAMRYEQKTLASEIAELDARLDELESRVDGMTEAEKIANAVATAVEKKRRAHWTKWRKAAAGLAGAILLIPALHEFISIILGSFP